MLQGECREGGVELSGTARDFKSSSAELAHVLLILKITAPLLSFTLSMQRSGFVLQGYSPGYLVVWQTFPENNAMAISLVCNKSHMGACTRGI